jgi:hypothetical protein
MRWLSSAGRFSGGLEDRANLTVRRCSDIPIKETCVSAKLEYAYQVWRSANADTRLFFGPFPAARARLKSSWRRLAMRGLSGFASAH